MNRRKTIYTTFYLIFLMAFTGCATKAAVKPAADGKTTMSLDIDLGGTLTATLDSAMAGLNEIDGTNGKQPLFDTKAIKKSVAQAGFSEVEISSPERQKLHLAFTGFFDFISYTTSKTTVTLSPASIVKFSNSLGEEFKSVMDLFMAPVLSDEEMSRDEYKELVAVIYGEKLAADLMASNVELSITSPKGKTKVHNIPLVDLLILSEEKVFTSE
ncbi:MAG: hypothetical protein KBS64_08145 [Treponema sp.]|nr:hypothetical protein [Candidatus Treponema equi]